MAAKTIINKMTFYDIVTLVIPSATMCYTHNWIPISCSDSWVFYIVQFGIIMMFGFILKAISSWWGKLWFRNNTDIIKQERQRMENVGEGDRSCRFLDILVFDPLKYICSIIMFFCYSEDSHELKEYYDKYDIAYERLYSGKRIDILESHVAFLQTWIFALIISMFGDVSKMYPCQEHFHFWTPCALLLLGYICIIIMLSTQRNIYRIVFENSKEK